MPFDSNLYQQLLEWANSFLSNYKIDNLTCFDLIHEAYLKTVEAKEDFTTEKAKKYARIVMLSELHLFNERKSDTRYRDQNWGTGHLEKVWTDSWAVCTKCGEAQPVAAFGTDKGKYIDGYCKECMAKINKKNRIKEFKQTCVKQTCRITVLNHFGEEILKAKSIVELAIRFNKCSKKLIDMILYKGYKHGTIHLYSDNVKFLEKRFTNAPMNYYIKKESL